MTAWFLFAILAFLVFGVPLIDDLYKMNVRRKTKASGEMHHSPPLVPGMNQEHLPASEMPATHENTPERIGSARAVQVISRLTVKR